MVPISDTSMQALIIKCKVKESVMKQNRITSAAGLLNNSI